MRVYISADIEGVAGVAHLDETIQGRPGYEQFREQMTRETAAACEGALAAGAKEILVQDAHDTGRNLLHEKLPREASLVRGWSGDPLMMVQELDREIDALLMVGYHAASSTDGNPLAHTMTSNIERLLINGETASEFMLHALCAAQLGVPTAFLAGDRAICEAARELVPGIGTVAVSRGVGGSTVAVHPGLVVERIRETVERTLGADFGACLPELPPVLEVEFSFRRHADARRAGHYPGAERESSHGVRFRTESIIEVMRMLLFIP